MHDGEDGRVRPDPECQRQHRERDEGGTFPELPPGKADVLPPFGQPVDRAFPARLARHPSSGVCSKLLRVAEAANRLGAGLGFAKSGRAEVGDAHRQMCVHLFVDLAHHARTATREPEQAANAVRKS